MMVPIEHSYSIMRLAHPLRIQAAMPEFISYFEDLLGDTVWNILKKELQTENTLTSPLIERLCERPEFELFKQFVIMASTSAGGTEMGNAYAILAVIRHVVAPQAYFLLSDEVVSQLELTDIADDIPISMLQLPYSRFYIEFGKERNTNLRILNTESGEHIVEGCYCEQGIHSSLGTGFYVVITGSPLGKSDAMDDATMHIFLPTGDTTRSIKDLLRDSLAIANNASEIANLTPTPEHFSKNSFETLLFLTKALLYIGLPSVRKSLNDEKTKWLKASIALKSTAKKVKAEKRARALVDHILILPPVDSVKQKYTAGSQHLKSHWRRGHYRLQPFGPGSTQRKIIFLSPMLIGEPSSNPSLPSYITK